MKKHLLRKILLNVVMGGALLLPNFLNMGVEAATTSNTISVGQKINFGNYWQNGSGSDISNYTKSAITWRALTDLSSNKVTLLTEKVLYADSFKGSAPYSNAWADSDVKATLNNRTAGNGFAGDAFTDAEWEMIAGKTYDVNAVEFLSRNVTSTTQDTSKLYLLDATDDITGFSLAAGTDFFSNVKVYNNNHTGTIVGGNACWWLRSGRSDDNADAWGVSFYGGSLYTRHVLGDNSGVRPALDLDLTNLSYVSVTTGGKSTATVGSAVKFGTITSDSLLDVTLKDTSNTYTNTITASTLALDGSNVKMTMAGGTMTDSQHWATVKFDATDDCDTTYLIVEKGVVLSGEKAINIGDYMTSGKEYNLQIANEYAFGGSIYYATPTDIKGTFSATSNNVNYKMTNGASWTSISVGSGNTFEMEDTCNISTVNFASGSTLKVDGAKITGTAAINGITSANVESGAKLYVSNAVKNTPYKILAGSGISVSGWQTDAEMGDGFRGMYGLIVDTDSITNNSNEFIIQFKAAFSEQSNVDVPNLLENTIVGSKLYKFVDTISQAHPEKSIQATIINTMSNLNSLANVQQSTYTVSNMAADSIHHNIDVFQRPILAGHKAQGIGHKAEGVRNREEGLRNVFANDKDTAEIKTVEQGESGNIMPAKATTEPQTYNKEVWANYIHSKRTIDGMKTGKFLQQDSTSQYNGITTGIDLWNSRHGFGGIALTTVDGEINSNQTASSIKNETEYKGVSVYNRYDTKNTAILTDFTYTHSDHDIKMSTQGTEDITAKPKADAYSIGIRAEQPIAVSKTSEIAPYAGVRYTKISTKDYKTSLDLQYDIDSPKIFNIPIGIAWRNKNQTAGGWEIGEVIETGYIWNLGDRNSRQHLSYGGINDNIGFAMADKGEYFARMALQAIHKDTDFEVGYKYTKGDTVKDSQWNFNVNVGIGLPHSEEYIKERQEHREQLLRERQERREQLLRERQERREQLLKEQAIRKETAELNQKLNDLIIQIQEKAKMASLNEKRELNKKLKQLLASKGI